MVLDDRAVQALAAGAMKARESAYAPYSGYRVGAAVVAEDDRVFFGCNVENASYGLSLCAERSAMAAAITAGAKRFAAVVVVTDADPPGTPCGACRQWMAELGGDGLLVVAANMMGRFRQFTLDQLLPDAFLLELEKGSR